MAQDSCQHRGHGTPSGTSDPPALPRGHRRFTHGLAGTLSGPGPPAPASGSAAVNPAAQPATIFREAVLAARTKLRVSLARGTGNPNQLRTSACKPAPCMKL